MCSMYFATFYKLAVIVAFTGTVAASPSSLETRQACSNTCWTDVTDQCMSCPNTTCMTFQGAQDHMGVSLYLHSSLDHSHQLTHRSQQACVPNTCKTKTCNSDSDCSMQDCPNIEIMEYGKNITLFARCDKNLPVSLDTGFARTDMEEAYELP